MGSYENIIKLEEMKRKVDEGDLLSALKILDGIDYKKIKHITDLHLIAEVLTENGKYEEAAELYSKIYEKTKSRKALFQLTEISIKLNNTEDAEYFLGEYQKLAPNDYYNYVFRYKFDKLKGESYDHLIEILEELKRIEYTEKWAYELAKLYYKAGLEQKCIHECNDIVLWFGEGIFVEKAKILRSYYLTDTDKDGIMKEIKRRAGIFNEAGTAEKQPVDEEAHLDADSVLSEDISEDSPEEAYSENTMVGQQDSESGLSVEIQDMPEHETNLETPTDLREIAEEEVEQAIYDILEEEGLEEENKKLKQISEELQINLEEIFKDYLQVPSVKKQLVKSLDAMLQEQTRMLIIIGSQSSGKTTLAKEMALFLYKAGKLKSSKMAKITAEKLNDIEVLSKKDRLRDCCLLIEHAGKLKRKTIEGILDLASILQEDVAVIFEEEENHLNQLFKEYPKLMDLVQNRIHLM
jgi:molybdopterin-guanine dinucleotide biosynthesis protein